MIDSVQPIDDEQLLDFAAGRLRSDAARAVERYVREHPEAQATVARFRLVAQTVKTDTAEPVPERTLARARSLFAEHATATATTPSIVDRLRHAAEGAVMGADAAMRRVAASIAFDSRLDTALAGYRAGGVDGHSDEPYHLTYQSGAGMIDLEIEPPVHGSMTPDLARQWRLMGQFAAPSGELPSATVTVLGPPGRGGPVVDETVADEFGFFSLAIEPGTYDLEVAVNGTADIVVIRGLSVG